MEHNRKEQELWIFLVSWAKIKFTKNMRRSYEKNWMTDQWWDLHQWAYAPEGRIGLYGPYEFERKYYGNFLFIQGREFWASWRTMLPNTRETEAATKTGDKEKWETLLQAKLTLLDDECIWNSSTYLLPSHALDSSRNTWGVRNVHKSIVEQCTFYANFRDFRVII